MTERLKILYAEGVIELVGGIMIRCCNVYVAILKANTHSKMSYRIVQIPLINKLLDEYYTTRIRNILGAFK